MAAKVELDAPVRLSRLYAKAAASVFSPRGDTLPDLHLTLREAPVDAAHVAAYNRVCGFRLGNRVPPTYPHLVAFPLAVQLMTDRSFPFALPGLVHVANRITVHRPIAVTETLSVTVTSGNLRNHRKGLQFDINAAVSVGGEDVWTSVSTYLQRGTPHEDAGAPPARSSDHVPTETTAVWRVPGDAGRRYAAVSGDRNPIHLSALSARVFGFPRAIAHGMWTLARCVAALERDIPGAAEIAVQFVKPVLLPATVTFAVDVGDGIVFAVRDQRSGDLHLSGTVASFDGGRIAR